MDLTDEEETIIKGIVARVKREIAGDLSSMRITDDEKKANIAQNVLSAVMVCTFNELIPYSRQFPWSMAMRLASYAISAGPANVQNIYVKNLIKEFREYHAERLRKGIIIEGDWT